MPLSTTLDATSPDFETNAAEWRRIADELRARRAEAAQGGNAKARERHLSRGKLLPRERVTPETTQRRRRPRVRHVRGPDRWWFPLDPPTRHPPSGGQARASW